MGGGGGRGGGGLYCLGEVSHNFEVKLKLHNPLIRFSKYHIKIFSFSFLYFSSIANVIALSILYIKHPNKHNQQFDVKAILQKKIPIHVKLGVT